MFEFEILRLRQILYVDRSLDKSQIILNSNNYFFRVLRYIDKILVVSLIQYNQSF